MKVLLLAGEESGLLYADGIAAALRARVPGVEIRGYADYGFATHDMAVMGILPVLLKLRYFLRLKRTMEGVIDTWRPDAVVTVDYPGLNLKLAAHAHARGIRTVHVVCPQVWAWKRGRIPKIEASLDRLCCFLPFEPALFKPGFATFVGHPLAAAFANAAGAARAADGVKTVALLPGSRKGEIEKILPVLLAAAARLAEKYGAGVRFVIPAATPRARTQIEKTVRAFASAPRPALEVRLGGARELLKVADCAAVASGTATLEAALARCPTVLVYRMTATFAWFVRHFVRGTRFAGLANIIWDRSRPDFDPTALRPVGVARPNEEGPMPELIQEALTPAAVFGYLDAWLGDPECRAAATARLDDAMALLRTSEDAFSRIVSILRDDDAE